MPYYLTPKQDGFKQELQICIAEALYDVDSIVADPGVYIKNNSRPYTGGVGIMLQIPQVIVR